MAAGRRLAASVLAASLGLAGCTYASEPGLFSSKAPGQPDFPSRSPSAPTPEPTNPELPVAGERVWTSAEGLSVTVRYAVHAVRRIPGGSVLDWSVTPLSAPDLQFGAAIPGVMNLASVIRGRPSWTSC